MDSITFLVIEIPSLRAPRSEFTKTYPTLIVDSVTGPVARLRGSGPAFKALCLARGVPQGKMKEMLEIIRAKYRSVRAKERDDLQGRWLGTFAVASQELADPSATAILRFLEEKALPVRWGRVEHGSLFLRAALPPAVDPRAIAHRCEGFLEAMQVDAHVAAEEDPASDHGPWMELVQRTVLVAAEKQRKRPR